jgi:hypothetical protein
MADERAVCLIARCEYFFTLAWKRPGRKGPHCAGFHCDHDPSDRNSLSRNKKAASGGLRKRAQASTQAHGSRNTIFASRSGPVLTIASGQPTSSSSARR